MLDRIPPEIISTIARHLCLSTSSLDPDGNGAPTSLPPLPPLNLLLSCRSIYEAVSPRSNPRLYAKLYRGYFDVAAAERRMGPRLRARNLCKELEKRVGALWRLRRQVQVGDVGEVSEGDLWVVYLMLIENDGKNAQHLLCPNAVLDLPTFLGLYHQQHFLASAIEPGYPAETVSRSLVMWIAWLIRGSGGPAIAGVDGEAETPDQREERQFVLRPYVFAAQHYEVYFAPWTLPDLPLTASANGDGNSQADPFVANLEPKSRLVTMELYGRQVQLAPPILAHAAILRFFFKKNGEWDDSAEGTPAATPFDMATGAAPGNLGPLPAINHLLDGLINNSGTYLDTPSSSSASTSKHPMISHSLAHDRDFTRLKRCFDPHMSRGMKRSAWRGSWDGCWEGTFSFFDFDAFRTMLAGNARALYEGPYGEQAQVWRIKETYLRRKGWTRGANSTGGMTRVDSEDEDEDGEVLSDDLGSDDLERFRTVDIHEDASSPHHKGKGKSTKKPNGKTSSPKTKTPALPLSGPMINAGFPTTDRPSVYASLASAAAEAETLRVTIQQQVESFPEYEVVPPDELEEMLNLPDGGEEAGLELLLSGTGHSAWGKFILKGRVRAWDGMASMVKEYAPDSRGKWIYRGYVVSGDIFVGRWRDTFTPEAYVGYEGTFILNRR